jgi:P-type Ca2+ transporter type 2C
MKPSASLDRLADQTPDELFRAGKLVVPIHTAVSGRARLRVAGMRGAPETAALLERGLAGFAGVQSASASPVTGNILVRYDSPVSLALVLHRIEKLLRREIIPELDDPAETEWHAMQSADVAALLDSSGTEGLSEGTARERIIGGQGNSMPPIHRRSNAAILFDQFNSMPVALLAGVAALSLATGALLEAGAIAAVLALNAAIGFATERQTERTISNLGLPAAPSARVVRNGRELELSADALVPGDLVLLQRGSVVPADGRLMMTTDLSVSEAALTGESVPVQKIVAARRPHIPLAERLNMVYRGTVVTGGSGAFVTVATGARTELGRIQRMVTSTIIPATPTQRHLDELGRKLVWAAVAGSGILFGIGWMRGLSLLQLIRSSVSVGVAAIPEGLPMVATTALAIGVNKMRAHGILVRRLEALETLAAVNVICFDKTGTLTQGSMSAQAIGLGDTIWRGRRNNLLDENGHPLRPEREHRLQRLLLIGVLCSDTELEGGKGDVRLVGSATENALVQLALDHGLDVRELRSRYLKHAVQHRTEACRFMLSIHRDGDGAFMAVKGSPLEVLARCRYEAMHDGSKRLLTAARRQQIEAQNAAMANRALRVLAMAYRELGTINSDGHVLGTEANNLVWTGLVGLADPVRPEIGVLMQKLRGAGIQIIMLTGDQSATARAVAEEVRLAGSGKVSVVDAAEFDSLSPSQLASKSRQTHAFARINPGQKLKIVRALQSAGSVVAMVGDGINDSPALRAADIGMAMGRDGDIAAREVADVFFADDNLAPLPLAIEHGRGTYTNIRRAIHYILSSNASEIFLMWAGALAGMGETLSPMQLLWINLISDVLPAIGIAMEAPDTNSLAHGPQPTSEPIVRSEQLKELGIEAAVLAGSALAAGAFGSMRHGIDASQGRTMAFGSLALGQLLHALNYRSPESRLLDASQTVRSPVARVVAGSVAAQLCGMLLPGVRQALNVAPLGILDVGASIAAGLLPFILRQAASSNRKTAELSELHFRRVESSLCSGPTAPPALEVRDSKSEAVLLRPRSATRIR